jgi:hypothetical protein
MAKIIQLSEDRVESFDHNSTAVHAVAPVVSAIRKLIDCQEQLTFLDVGGGNGTFLDTMLMAVPSAKGTLVEISKGMAEKNIASERKVVVCENFLDWAATLAKGSARYHVVFFNFVLHHFVGVTRKESILLQESALHAAESILAEGGLIVIYEIHYNGLFHGELPSFLIHMLSSSRVLAPLIKRLGANTAGYGVCFHSESYWQILFKRCGLCVAHDYLIERGVFAGGQQRMLQAALNIATMNYKIHFLQSCDLR